MKLRILLAASLFWTVPTGMALCIESEEVGEADAIRGEELYEARCTGCHSLDTNRIGPNHRGVHGRPVGSVDGFSYSAALTESDVVWDDQTLDLWLTNPRDFIPGQRMNFRVSDPQDRADIIAFLKTLSDEEPCIAETPQS